MGDGGLSGVMLNNIIYQWQGEWGVFLFSKYNEGPWYYTVVGNRWIVGPNSLNANVRGAYGGDAVQFWFGAAYPDAQSEDAGDQLYRADNTINNAFGITVVPTVQLMSYDPSAGVIAPPAQAPIPAGYTLLQSTSLESFLLPIIGARPADRDAVDVRLINNIINHQGNYISSVNDVAGGYPALAVNSRTLVEPVGLHTVQPSGYTVMEEWLHGYAAAVEGAGGTAGIVDATGTVFVLDKYVGASGTSVLAHIGDIGATYTNHATTSGLMALTGNGRLRLASSALLATVLPSGLPVSAEYDLTFDLSVLSLPAGESVGVWVRLDPTVLTGYQLYYDTDAALWTLRVATTGTFTILGTFAQTLTVGQLYPVKLQIRNGAQAFSVNNVLQISGSDNSVTAAGRVGVVAFGTADTNTTGLQIDNLTATDVQVLTDVPSATGTIFVQDTFTGVIGQDALVHTGEIGASYTNHATTTGQFVTTTLNRLRCSSNAALATVLASGLPISTQYDVQIDLVVRSIVASRSYAMWMRLDPTALTGYQIRYDTDSGAFELYAFAAGAFTLLDTYTQVLTAGQTATVRMKARTGAQYVSIDGVARLNALDVSVGVAGRVALAAFVNTADSDTTGIHFDNFLAQDVLSGAITLAGVQANTSIGAVGRTITRPLSGFGGTSAVGSVSAGNAKTVALTGITATTGQGTFGNIRTPGSVSGAVQIGTLGLSRVKALAGLAAAASIGAISVFQVGTVGLAGIGATTAQGSVGHATTRALTSTPATASRGTVIATQGGVSLTGVTGTTGQGLLLTPGSVTLTLDSVFATGLTGFVQGTLRITLDDGTVVTPNFLTIAGVQQQIYAGWSITQAANNTGTMRFGVLSADGSYIPALDAQVVYFENGEQVFGGNVSQVRTGGAGGEGSTAIVSDVTATDFNAIAGRQYFIGVLPIATLKHQLEAIVPYCYGCFLDPAQADGPTIDSAVDYTGWKISDLLNQLSKRTGYVWEIDYFKYLRMYVPGTKVAPFNITTPNSKAVLDVTVEPSRQNFANLVTVYGKNGKKSIASDVPSILANGFWEIVVSDSENDDQASLDHLAAAVLAASLPVLKTVKYNTLETGLQAGMTQQIVLPGRQVNNTYIISEVQRRYLRNYISGFAVTAIEGLVLVNGWREIIKTWGGANAGAPVTIGTTSTGTGTAANVRPVVQLGGNGTEATSSPTAGAWVPCSGGSQVIGQSSVQPSISTVPRGGNDAIITVRGRVLDSGNSVICRLFDVTVAAACPGTSVAITSTTWQTTVFATSLTPGTHYYELQLQTAIPNSDASIVGYLE